MFAKNHPDKLFVMIGGIPRTGTTIVASFLNSLEGATVWGEPHRSAGRRGAYPVRTRHATAYWQPGVNVLEQINTFADENDLWLRGFKEVLDTNLRINPIDLIQKYDGEIDLSIMMIRDPRKTWSSMFAIGHHRGLGIGIERFNELFIEFGEFCLENDSVVPVVMSNFISSPVVYAKRKFGLSIEGSTKLLQYTGGGDPASIQDGTIVHRVDNRPSYIGGELNEASELYNEILERDNEV